MKRIFHLITDLDVGGAEMMLYRVLKRSDSESFQSQVISMTSIGKVGKGIEALGIPVRMLNMHPGRPNPSSLARLVRWFRQDKPDLLQTWLYHADLMGLIVSGMAGAIPVVWNLRASNMDMTKYRRLTGWIVWTCARLSGYPKAVVVNSIAGREYHSRIGYHPKEWVLIPNGVDIEDFKPSLEARQAVRKELGLPQDSILIGFVARYDPMKDHLTFFRAASDLTSRIRNVHFLLCGAGINHSNQMILQQVERLGLTEHVHLLGERSDVSRLTAALDIAALSSLSEGFSNIVIEAMACGVPCVVTDVGDSASIVGDTGRVVAPGDPLAMATAFHEILCLDDEDRRLLGYHARKRVLEHYSLESMVQRYEQLYIRLAADR